MLEFLLLKKSGLYTCLEGLTDPQYARRKFDIDLALTQDKVRLDIYLTNNNSHKAPACMVTVLPSSQSFTPLIYRFCFEIQYGGLTNNDDFSPIGELMRTQSESLPPPETRHNIY